MRLTSESLFIWVYNQTLPTKPNLSEWLFLTSECLFVTSECLFQTSECLFLPSECLFLTSECLFLTSESPFIWVYNQTLPSKPDLSSCPRAYSQRPSAYSQPEGKGPLRGPLMLIFFKVTTNFECL